MKKIFIIFIICILLIFGIYILKDNTKVIEFVNDINIEISNIVSKNDFKYTNEFKVNKLQIKNADYYFNKLSENQKLIYSEVALGVSTLNKDIYIKNYKMDSDSSIVSQDVYTAISYFLYDHPEVFYLKTNYNVSIKKSLFNKSLYVNLDYNVKDMEELNLKINEIDNVIANYISLINLQNDFDKQLLLHDTIIKDIDYYEFGENINNIPDEYHNIYNAIVNKSAVCDGLTKSMQIALDRVGIESIIVTGVLEEIPHAWNMVKINNEWYHMDLTSNKYVKKDSTKTVTIAHTYFNVSTDYILKTHKIDIQNDLPIADKNIDNYYIKMNCNIKSNDSLKSRIKDIINIQSARNCIEFSIDYDKNIVNELSEILYDLNFNNYQKKGNKYTFKYYNFLNTYIVEKE